MTQPSDDVYFPTNVGRPVFSGGSYYEWVDDAPQPMYSKPMVQKQSQQLYYATGGGLYKGRWDNELKTYAPVEPRFEGLTNQEVITLLALDNALSGDAQSIEKWQDRVLGKPKQAIEAAVVDITFTQYLDMLADKHGMTGKDEPLQSETPYNPSKVSHLLAILDEV